MSNTPTAQPESTDLKGRILVVTDKWSNRTRYVKIDAALVNGEFDWNPTLDIFETPRTGASPLITGVKLVRKPNGDFVGHGTFTTEFLKWDTYSLVPLKDNTRTATVDATKVGWGSDPLKVVNAYLPRTFSATREGDVITIVGTDDHGWTLEDYVLPRLASAMIYATEVK